MRAFYDILRDYTTTVGELKEIDEILVWPLFIQSIFGQQILNPNWTWKNKTFKHAFWICLIIYVILGTLDVLKRSADVTAKGEGYYTFVVILTFVLKYCAFTKNRIPLQNVYLIAKTTLFEMIKRISLTKSIDMMKKIRIVVKLYLFTIALPIVMYIVLAIWSNLHGERVTLSKTTSTLMPMTSPYYEVSFILHTIFLSYMSFTICIIDMWFVLVIFFFCVSCECLVISLQLETKGIYESDLSYALRLNETLSNFYKCHRDLMMYFNIFSNMYKWPAVIPLFNVLMAFCILMFIMSEEIHWNLMANLVPVVVEIFAYNWFGEHLKLKVSELKTALLEFDWSNMKVADKKNYIIIVTYMNKELSIRTALGNDLSLDTMTDVLKASYQAFTLLKTMK